MSSLKEIENTYNAAKNYGIKDVSLLYCVSNYPSKNSDFNLNNIKIMKKKFKCEIGFSDHSNDFRVASAAVGVGATIIEKHISLKNIKSLDLEFSINGEQIYKYKTYLLDNKKLKKINYFTELF